jgi:hypothetical protein
MGLSIYNLSGKTHMVGSKFFNFNVKIVESMQIINPKRKGSFIQSTRVGKEAITYDCLLGTSLLSLSLSLSLSLFGGISTLV